MIIILFASIRCQIR